MYIDEKKKKKKKKFLWGTKVMGFFLHRARHDTVIPYYAWINRGQVVTSEYDGTE